MMLFRSGNGSHECENATNYNAQFLQENPAVRFYYGLVVCLTGSNFLLNLLCFLVFRSMRPRRQFNRLLMLLSMVEAVFQAVFCCNHALVFCMDTNQLTLPTMGVACFVSVLLMLSLCLLTAVHLMRNWCVVLISYYRWVVVSQSLPSAAQQGADLGGGSVEANGGGGRRRNYWPTSKVRVRQGLAAAMLISLLVSAPRLFEFQVVTCSTSNQVTHVDNLLGKHAAYRVAYLGVVLCIFQSVGPIVCLLAFSLCLVQFLVHQSRRRMSLNLEPCERFRARNRTVLLLCTLFLLCEWPTLLKSVDPMNERWQAVGFTANFLTCLSSTLNILVYNCAHEKFADGLVRKLTNGRRLAAPTGGNVRGGGVWVGQRRARSRRNRRCSSAASVEYAEAARRGRRRFDGRLRAELEISRSFCTTTIGGGLDDEEEYQDRQDDATETAVQPQESQHQLVESAVRAGTSTALVVAATFELGADESVEEADSHAEMQTTLVKALD